MKIIDGEVITSATDLANYMGCRHVTVLDKKSILNQLEKPHYYNPTLEALKERGQLHEQHYLKHLKDQGLQGVELDSPSPEKVVAAMREGAEFIYQAYLNIDGWRGYADFVTRVDKPSNLGDWSYEILDAKLAKETRGETILQLCVYSEILSSLQGVMPEYAQVLTPKSVAPEHYRLAEYMAYYRLVKANFSSFVAAAETVDSYPEPCEKCDRCDWYAHCEKRWRDEDHLTFVAGIHRSQRTELVEHGVTTLAALGQLPIPLEFRPTRGSVGSLTNIREQARVQLEARESGEPKLELLKLEPGFGLYLLPEPSPGDVFFDIEGARFVGDQGFEYLLGYAIFDDNEELIYEKLLADNPEQEATIFDQFMQTMAAILSTHPDMHIFHYHSYEPSALKRLAGRYAIHQDLLDDLLRRETFVDLHRVVKHTLRAGIERYSIKDLESFFGFEREVDLRAAGDARQSLESWCEFGYPINEAPIDQVHIVIEYNKDDCLATKGLRDWLEQFRTNFTDQGEEIPRPKANPEVSEELSERLRHTRSLSEQLRDGLPESGEGLSNEDRARWLLSHLLEFHRREDKSTYWEKFRLAELDEDERREDKSAISGIQFLESVDYTTTGIPTDRYQFPPQELTIKRGDQLHIDKDTKWGNQIVEIDYEHCTFDLKKTKATADLHAGSAFSWSIVTARPAEDALLRLAEKVIEGKDGGVAIKLLQRQLPTFSEHATLADAHSHFDDELALAKGTINQLEQTTLPIQGPPGTGKTFTGAHMILAAVTTGKKIGVTAQSHKVILNLLKGAIELARAQDIDLNIIRNPGSRNEISDEDQDNMIQLGGNDEVEAGIRGECQIAAGTHWLWSREEMADVVDVLFIDEAGQFSLANTCAVAQAADSLVLLGDPQQLDQPLQGTHPPGTEVSGLQHLLGDAVTMPPERGLFLPDTWRMHPNICTYISEMFYDGKLESEATRINQKLVHQDFPEGAGLWFLPVEHQGNQNASVEEAERVQLLIGQLLDGGKWRDDENNTHDLKLENILVVSPYNAQVGEIAKRIDNVNVGTVDRFQGQEAPVVIISYATSTPEEAPRGMDFLYSLNRLNVAVSRAKCAVFLICSPEMIQPECKNPKQMRLANGLARYVERSFAHGLDSFRG